MGKKKDKAKKAKKAKMKAKQALEVGHDAKSPVEPEIEAVAEPEPESIQYAEYVTAEDVMELINTLSRDLNKLDESNQLLQQQVAQSQKAPQRQHTILKIITLILGIGIIAVGYSSAKVNSRMNENIGVTSADLDKTTSRINTMSASIKSLTSDINDINTSLGKLSADVTTINQNVNKVVSDVSKINTSTASKPHNTEYKGRPMDRRYPWR